MTTTPDFRALLADDAYAASFQSMGQYRTALLKALATPPPEPPPPYWPTRREVIQLAMDTRHRFQATTGDPIQYEMTDVAQLIAFARAVLERWGHR
jgi:hypothetical protein